MDLVRRRPLPGLPESRPAIERNAPDNAPELATCRAQIALSLSYSLSLSVSLARTYRNTSRSLARVLAPLPSVSVLFSPLLFLPLRASRLGSVQVARSLRRLVVFGTGAAQRRTRRSEAAGPPPRHAPPPPPRGPRGRTPLQAPALQLDTRHGSSTSMHNHLDSRTSPPERD